MGYCFTIGEMTTNGDEHGDVRLDAVDVLSADAASMGAPLNSSHDYANCILPSYSGWSRFMKGTGLEEHLLGVGINLVPSHPGVCYISKTVRDAILGYGKEWLENNPVVERRIERSGSYRGVKVVDEFECYQAARMRWLVWWVEWAYNNCDFPVIANG